MPTGDRISQGAPPAASGRPRRKPRRGAEAKAKPEVAPVAMRAKAPWQRRRQRPDSKGDEAKQPNSGGGGDGGDGG
eukprot:CAMPEP_0118882298 /NCGR_PEP_ID=MMETSP1163-20130328/21572_1 /TAXON_ID=124430 /ORGANISM="Phaeomonas parva, Strain CCMP2877" /LENGTH=75 /DNA_ID=CAMNT_0006819305 /DNA_START=17 /DNA_END=240 /DNA_ORIENTATION=+